MGALDEGMRSAANAVVDALVDGQITVKRTASGYSYLTEATGPVVTNFLMKAAPPEKFELSEINGTSVKTGDVKVFVPALQYEPATPTGLTAPVFTKFDAKTDKVVLIGSTDELRIVDVDEVWSGDQIAGVELQLRK